MKKQMVPAALSMSLIILMSGCEQPKQGSTLQNVNDVQETEAPSKTDVPFEDMSSELLFELSTTQGETILVALNNSNAAKSFYEQLPLSVDIEDYGAHEKIFDSPETLDTSDTPLAKGPIGTVAYYAPWGNIAIYTGDCGGASGLYQLGQVVSGVEYISQLSGVVQLRAAQDSQ